MKRPNILWYCTDQQRFDTIASLGNPYIRTPRIDELVGRGVAFTRAYTQSPICTPSRASFLTGRYPAAHHVQRNGADFFPPNETLVTRLLAEAGYDCGLIGKLHLSRAKGRIERRPNDGYRMFRWSHHPMPDWPEGHAYAEWLSHDRDVDPNTLFARYRAEPWGVPEEYHQTTWCTEAALRFLDEERDGPWLLSINPFDPHPPYDAPKEYLDRYDSSRLPLPVFGERDIAHQERLSHIDQQTRVAVDPRLPNERRAEEIRPGTPDRDATSDPPKHYDARAIKANYYAMIELIDTQFGRIVDRLEERDELEDTIIVFTSDHGELLGDHGLLYKGCRFYDGLVRVPLIFSWPARWSKGLFANGLVELVDIAPTLLDAAGIERPAAMQGIPLTTILSGAADPNEIREHVISEYWDAIVCPDGRQDHTHATMYFDGRYKSVVYHGRRLGELYDMQEDPDEIYDLWDHAPRFVLRSEVLLRHFDAFAASTWAGIERTGPY